MLIKTIELTPCKTGKRWYIVKNAIDNPIILSLNLGNGTAFRVIFFRFIQQYRLFVGIEGKGCFLFRESKNYVSPKYVAEKLNLEEGDADNLADWLNAQLNVNAKEFGYYNDIFMQ